ncbi:MAG TPA: flagellar hook-length control protein FliK [Pseudomonas sp.]|uniref:flagellar hook-length control protein FliK n=1 Tax=Pseudomonas sp. TaxID=306 RepID=UPI002B476723|nr:flagellar hook-length control protein FliK [Pseudomonas sp.]HKS11642.1 flagellar hook-length control protein FliK [Pseudomonas sp.]
MPVASNPLLQASAVGTSARTTANLADKTPHAPASGGAGFDQVLARQGRDDQVASKSKARADQADSGKPRADAAERVADDGKDLPAADDTSDDVADTTVRDASLVAGQVTDAQPGAQMIQAQAQTLTPMLQQQAATASGEDEAAALAAFDPEADPLDGLPALRLALEQSAQAQGGTSAHAAGDEPEVAQGQPAVNTLASLLQQAEGEPGEGERGDKAFGALLDDSLKDLKGASSDTRVDDFADRLAALTQAAVPKAAHAVPSANLMQQPLAMTQSGWTEGLVNRVMYLSSQNLKSADIQLAPAELGRLDIRVNLATDQPAQVTFMSGHVGVRDALEGQVQRLRELFAQQGLAQPDVNVADQSRGQQQQAQQDAPQFSGVAARRAAQEGEGADVANTARPVEQQVVIGSSAVDYYA